MSELMNESHERVGALLIEALPYIQQFAGKTVVVLVGSVNQGVLQAVRYAQSLRPDRVIALSVIQSPTDRAQLDADWEKYNIGIELDTVVSEYRDLTEPILNRINELDDELNDDIITVIIPEFVTSLRSQWLHNQSALAIKARLLFRPNTVVTSVPIVIP